MHARHDPRHRSSQEADRHEPRTARSLGADALGGGPGDDRIFGGRGADTIDGGDGNDLIRGGRGGDVIDAGAGNDRIYAGRGADVIDAGEGDDVARVLARDGRVDRVHCGPGRDTIWLQETERDEHVNCEVVKIVTVVVHGEDD